MADADAETNDTKRPPPPDWAQDMAKVPFNPMDAVRAASFAHSPCGMAPRDYDAPQVRPNPPTTGWVDRPLVNPAAPAHPTPGVDLLDRKLAAEAQREAEAQAAPSRTEKLMEVAAAVFKQQAEIMKFLAGQKK